MASNLKDAILEHFATKAVSDWINAKRKDRAFMGFLTGYKTYIVAGVLLLLAVLNMFGVTIPGVPPVSLGDSVTGILAALGLTAARAGATTDAAKALVAASQNTVPSTTTVASAKAVVASTK